MSGRAMGVGGSVGGGAGMMRPGMGAGKNIPDANLWGVATQGGGAGLGAGVGVGGSGTGQHSQQAQQQQRLTRAPDSFSFVRDAMDDLIK